MGLKRGYIWLCTTVILTVGLVIYLGGNGSVNALDGVQITPPTFSKDSGSYSTSFDLELSAPDGCKIYYSTDGSIPTVSDEGEETNLSEVSIPVSPANSAFATNAVIDDSSTVYYSEIYGSICFTVPAGKTDWTKYERIELDITAGAPKTIGGEVKLTAAPIKAGSTGTDKPSRVFERYYDVKPNANRNFIWSIPLDSTAGLDSVGWFMLRSNGNDTGNVTINAIKLIPSLNSSKTFIHKYEKPILVKDRTGEANVLATSSNVSKMYPSSDSPFVPTNDNVAKATVIRAIAVDEQGNTSAVVTRTYFIGNNLDRYNDIPVLSMVTDPKNLLDNDIGIYVRGNGSPYNYEQKGREWEREAVLDFFNEEDTIGFSAGIGIRIHGGYTRRYGQKSISIYFRDEYGLKNLNYKLIPGATNFEGTKDTTKYKNFTIRNGGNDTEYTKLRDVFIQSLVPDRSFTTQSSRPCILYLNGEYWGLYNIQEKYSQNYLEEEFGVDKDEVIIIENGVIDEGVEEDISLFRELVSFGSKDMKVPANYAAFCEIADIQSYIDYYATQIYIGNKDWPDNNERLWTVRTPSGKKYEDGKWRWLLYDTEYSMNLYNQTGNDFDTITHIQGKVGNDNANLFCALMQNESFQRQFVNTLMDLYNKNFDYESNITALNQFVAIYRPLMKDYYNRFGGSYNSFDSNIGQIESFLNARRTGMLTILSRHFKVGKSTTVTVSSANKTKDEVKINTITPDLSSGSWQGKYYTAYPITVTANAPNGYEFVSWSVSGGNAQNASSQTTTITLTETSANIKANFKLIGSTPPPTSTVEPTASPVPTASAEPTPTASPDITPTPTVSPNPSPTPTVLPIPMPTPTTPSPSGKDIDSSDVNITVNRTKIKSIKNKKTKTLILKLQTVKGAKGYQVIYANNKKFTKGKKVITVKGTLIKVRNMKKGATYYLKVRAYKLNTAGKKAYGPYSKVKSIKIKK